MKELIKQALNNALQISETKIPKTKKETKYLNIENIKPFELSDFLIKNNFPKNCWFGWKPNGYDSFAEVCLCYEIETPLDKKEIESFKNTKFHQIAFNEVYKILTSNGYKRKGFNSNETKQFKNTNILQIFMNNDIETLEKYYSLYFKKIN